MLVIEEMFQIALLQYYYFAPFLISIYCKIYRPMVQLPNRKLIKPMQTDKKPPFFFKRLKFTTKGLHFDNFTEFKMHDGLGESIRISRFFDRLVCMNDLFLAYSLYNKTVLVVIFRKNVQFARSLEEIPEEMDRPFFLNEDQFPDNESYAFYKFVKLIESKSVLLCFKHPLQKILMNGDQLIIMMKCAIIIFTPFATSVIEGNMIDMAIDRYLYILTPNQIWIYGEELIKKIDISMKCNFIIPSVSHVFVIRNGTVYKITDDNNAEIYFECNTFIESCCSDDNHMFLATKNCVYKVGLYDNNLSAVFMACFQSARLAVNDDLVVLSSASGATIFIKKSDFSTFCSRNIEKGLNKVCLYKNNIVYSLDEELLVFEYKIEGNDLIPVELENRKYNNTIKTWDMMDTTSLFIDKNNDLNIPIDLSMKDKDEECSVEMMSAFIPSDKNEILHDQSFPSLINVAKSTDSLLPRSNSMELINQKASHLPSYEALSEQSSTILNSQNFTCAQPPEAFPSQMSNIHNLIENNIECANQEGVIISEKKKQFRTNAYYRTFLLSIEDFPIVKKLFVIPSPETFYGSTFYNKPYKVFDKLLRFNLKRKNEINADILNKLDASEVPIVDEYANLVADVTDNATQTNEVNSLYVHKVAELLPSPLMTQYDPFSLKSGNYDKSSNTEILRSAHFADFIKSNLEWQCSKKVYDKKTKKLVEKRLKKIRHFFKANKLQVEESESSSIEGLFFDNPEIKPRSNNPLIMAIEKSNYKRIPTETNTSKLAFSIFRKINKRCGIRNSLTIGKRIDSVETNTNSQFKISKRLNTYPKTMFFRKAFMDFYKDYSVSRGEAGEQKFNSQIYDFVNEEFKKIIGYKQVQSSTVTAPKVEIIKKKKSGF